jgi:hypothetical protein
MNDGATKSKMRLQLVRSNHGRSLSDIESMWKDKRVSILLL